MRLMFVYYAYENAGSGIDMQGYSQAARALGHEVVLYGTNLLKIPLKYSLDIESADALIFIFEWTTELLGGDGLDFVRLLGKIPRARRVVIDCDGNYNDAMKIAEDYNHRDAGSSRRWLAVCDSLSDKICQPSLHPLRKNVRPFLFHAYNPEWQLPLDFNSKAYGMMYVGHSKFRWHPMHQVLRALEPFRKQVGRIGIVGHGWDALPSWAASMKMESAYFSDPTYLRKLEVEVKAPIPFGEAIGMMSQGCFNPVLYRPLFNHLQLVTCRTFETPAAGTIPLFLLDKQYVREIYGERAVELVFEDDTSEKILDVLNRPEYYAEIVIDIRHHLAQYHSYKARLQELLKIVNS